MKLIDQDALLIQVSILRGSYLGMLNEIGKQSPDPELFRNSFTHGFEIAFDDILKEIGEADVVMEVDMHM